MKGSMIRCIRCKGRKKIYKINNGYSYINTGGVQIECPMCLGNGVIKSLEEAIEEIKTINKKHKSNKTNKKDCKDAERTRESVEEA